MKFNALLFSVCSIASAEQAIYIHPASLLAGDGKRAAELGAEDRVGTSSFLSNSTSSSRNVSAPMWLNLTWERSLDSGLSLVVDPSIRTWHNRTETFTEGWFDTDTEEFYEKQGQSASIYLGIRQSSSWNNMFFYRQLSGVALHEHAEFQAYTDGNFTQTLKDKAIKDYFGLGGVAYGGMGVKLGRLVSYADVGLGGALPFGGTSKGGYGVPSLLLIADVNWAVGIAF